MKLRDQLQTTNVESIRHILDEQEPQHRVFILRGIKSGAQFVCCGPELLFKVVEKLYF